MTSRLDTYGGMESQATFYHNFDDWLDIRQRSWCAHFRVNPVRHRCRARDNRMDSEVCDHVQAAQEKSKVQQQVSRLSCGERWNTIR